ncbi:beta-lactamase (plasmid) [Rhodococcus ruber]|nr:beta-lactamase [Rhodococcus ruber]
MPLYRIAQARSGDKNDTSDISIFLGSRELYELCTPQLTAEKVKEFLAPLVHGEVQRYEMPNLFGLKFVCHQALGGGGSSSLRSDNLGKALGSALLRFTVQDIPAELAEASPLYAGPTSRSNA